MLMLETVMSRKTIWNYCLFLKNIYIIINNKIIVLNDPTESMCNFLTVFGLHHIMKSVQPSSDEEENLTIMLSTTRWQSCKTVKS